MDENQNDVHVYPVKEPWQTIYRILGFWSWLCSGFDLYYILNWARWRSALRKMMAGESRSYLRVSKDGLVYRNWPMLEIRCTWDDVKYLRRGRWPGDVLYLERAEEIGFLEISINLSRPRDKTPERVRDSTVPTQTPSVLPGARFVKIRVIRGKRIFIPRA